MHTPLHRGIDWLTGHLQDVQVLWSDKRLYAARRSRLATNEAARSRARTIRWSRGRVTQKRSWMSDSVGGRKLTRLWALMKARCWPCVPVI